jgi:hypothetical protein
VIDRPIGRLDKCKSVQSFWFALQRNSSLDDEAAKLYSPTLPPQVPARLADPVGGNNYLLAPRTWLLVRSMRILDASMRSKLLLHGDQP